MSRILTGVLLFLVGCGSSNNGPTVNAQSTSSGSSQKFISGIDSATISQFGPASAYTICGEGQFYLNGSEVYNNENTTVCVGYSCNGNYGPFYQFTNPLPDGYYEYPVTDLPDTTCFFEIQGGNFVQQPQNPQ